MSDNIIQFPNKGTQLPRTAEEAEIALEIVRGDYVHEVTKTIMDRISGDLYAFGFEPSDEMIHRKDWFFLGESIEAMLCRYAGIEHGLHPVVEDVIRFPGEPVKKVKAKKPRKKKSDVVQTPETPAT